MPPSNWPGTSEKGTATTTATLIYTPLSQNPPLHLVILAASDSPLTIDCPPERRGQHDNYDAVVAKFQLWAYMCQAFTAEQFRRNDMGRRPFALEEYDLPDTIAKRRRPYVHFLRSTHSLQEFRSPDCAQQVSSTGRRLSLASIKPLSVTVQDCQKGRRNARVRHCSLKSSFGASMLSKSEWCLCRCSHSRCSLGCSAKDSPGTRSFRCWRTDGRRK
jgi:hypothetical protein